MSNNGSEDYGSKQYPAEKVTPFDLINGSKRSDEEIAAYRLEICQSCEFFRKRFQQCSKCGCFMKLKTMIDKAACPVGKW